MIIILFSQHFISLQEVFIIIIYLSSTLRFGIFPSVSMYLRWHVDFLLEVKCALINCIPMKIWRGSNSFWVLTRKVKILCVSKSEIWILMTWIIDIVKYFVNNGITMALNHWFWKPRLVCSLSYLFLKVYLFLHLKSLCLHHSNLFIILPLHFFLLNLWLLLYYFCNLFISLNSTAWLLWALMTLYFPPAFSTGCSLLSFWLDFLYCWESMNIFFFFIFILKSLLMQYFL